MAPHRKARTRELDKSKDEDVSQLRQPITLHGKPVEQILNSIHYGSPELQNLLLHECDIILECKVCRALFRDLPNFISHKRRYCSKPAADNNHFDIGGLPDERVVVIQPRSLEKLETTNSCPEKLSSSSSSWDHSIKPIEKGGKTGKTNICEKNSMTVDDSKCENEPNSLGSDSSEKTESISNLKAVILDVRTVSEDEFVKSPLEPDDDDDDDDDDDVIILSPCASQIVDTICTSGPDNCVVRSNNTEKSYSESSAPVGLDINKDPISDIININNLSSENHQLHLDTNSCEDEIVEADENDVANSSSPNSPLPSGTTAGLQPPEDSEINLEMSFSVENYNNHGELGVLDNDVCQDVVIVDDESPSPSTGTIGDYVTPSEINSLDIVESESLTVYYDRDDECVVENFEKEKKEEKVVQDETKSRTEVSRRSQEVSTQSQVSTRSSGIRTRPKREIKVRDWNIKATQPISNSRGLSHSKRHEKRLKRSLHKSKMSSHYKAVDAQRKSLNGKNLNGCVQERPRGKSMSRCAKWKRFCKDHISTVQTYMDEKKLICRKCNSHFQTLPNLKRHVMSKHMGVNRFQCKFCGIKMFDSADVYRHIIRQHTKAENPFHWIISLF